MMINISWVWASIIVGLSSVFASTSLANDSSSRSKKFNLTDLDNLELFFIESINGMVVASNTSKEAYNNTKEMTPTKMVWSDQKRFPHGTVRWWLDQSPKGKPSKRKNKPFKSGRSFGQDDHDRPRDIPDGRNSKPCARGGLAPKGEQGKHKYHYKQPCYFELQPEDRFKFDGPFSLFLLVRPVKQQRDLMYFGVFHWSMLKHQLKDNPLHFKYSKYVKLTGPNAVEIGKWQLIELHRNNENQLRCIVNGKDQTLNVPAIDGFFLFTQLMINNKNIWKAADPFTGDLATFVLYSDMLSQNETQSICDYFNHVYDFKNEATTN